LLYLLTPDLAALLSNPLAPMSVPRAWMTYFYPLYLHLLSYAISFLLLKTPAGLYVPTAHVPHKDT